MITLRMHGNPLTDELYQTFLRHLEKVEGIVIDELLIGAQFLFSDNCDKNVDDIVRDMMEMWRDTLR